MTGTHFDVAVRAITAALGTRLTSGITSFPQLFTDDGVIEVPFDGDGSTPPMRGRDAFTAMVVALDGVLRFDKVTVTHVHDVDASTVICEYEALLHRADLGSSFRRRYIAVMTLRDRRIANLREYGGPLIPSE
jgi:uncharacterized protein